MVRRDRMTGRGLALAVQLAALAVVTAAGGCGFATDGAPRGYQPSQGPPSCDTTSLGAAADSLGIIGFGTIVLVGTAAGVSGSDTGDGIVVVAAAVAAVPTILFFLGARAGLRSSESCRNAKRIYRAHAAPPSRARSGERPR